MPGVNAALFRAASEHRKLLALMAASIWSAAPAGTSPQGAVRKADELLRAVDDHLNGAL